MEMFIHAARALASYISDRFPRRRRTIFETRFVIQLELEQPGHFGPDVTITVPFLPQCEKATWSQILWRSCLKFTLGRAMFY